MKRRLNNISIYRIIAAICILQFHIFYLLYNRDIPYEVLLSKGVQGLTALSGFLYSQKLITNYKKFYLNNLIKLIIPALVCVLFMVSYDVIYMLITQNFDYMAFFTYRAYTGVAPRLISQADNYYYLAYIFICYLITPILQRNDKYTYIVGAGVLLLELAIGYFVGPAIIASTYVIGYLIGKKAFKTYVDNESKYSIKTLFVWIGIILASIGVYVIVHIYPIPFNNLNNLIKNIVATIFGVASCFLFLIIFRFLNRYKGSPILKYTDRLSLIIYLMNQAFMCGAMNISQYVEPMWLKTILVYIATIGASIILELISNKLLKLILNRPQKQLANE